MNAFFQSQIAARLDQLCKPSGSLGGLESIARQLCIAQRTLNPLTKPRHVTIFAADHGVTRQGVSAWPSDVTASVTAVMGRERTASGVFSRILECSYEVVDVGLLCPCPAPVLDCAVRRSTDDLSSGPAMSLDDFHQAWQVGTRRATVACECGNRILIGGEMGIGNTTSASCLIGIFCQADSQEVVGRGAGVDDTGLDRKREVVAKAMHRVRSIDSPTPQQIACEVGGLEIVALAGFYQQAAMYGKTILLDGLIATSAALLAEAVSPGVRDYIIAGHKSAEPGHAIALEMLDLDPILDLQLRLGEGTGALAALSLLDLAAAMMNDMATIGELV